MKTCSTCKHWVKAPADPNNLGVPAAGECRESLHVITIPQQTLRGMVFAPAALYPVVPEGWPACGRHEERGLELAHDGIPGSTSHPSLP